MAGGDRVGAEAARALEQRRELQVAVAVRAGERRAARRRTRATKFDDDLLVELPLEVQDVVRDVDGRGHAPRVVQVVERAAAAERVRSPSRLIVELHRQTDDVVALLGEQRRGDRRIDAARHRDDDAHLIYRCHEARSHNTIVPMLVFVFVLTCDRLARQAAQLLDQPRQHVDDAVDFCLASRTARG